MLLADDMAMSTLARSVSAGCATKNASLFLAVA
jgi:hypothetical protein